MPKSSLRKRKILFGVAHNDADYKVSTDGFKCPYYICWHNMLKRCFYKKFKRKYQTYESCILCEEWLTFSNFKQWMEKQDWKDKDLDKDLCGGIIYSPKTCKFISKSLNRAIKESPKGKYPMGVGYRNKSSDMKSELKNCYQSRIYHNGVRKSLGAFSTPLDAHKAWQREKTKILTHYADKEQDPDIVNALLSIARSIEDDILNNRITNTLKVGVFL